MIKTTLVVAILLSTTIFTFGQSFAYGVAAGASLNTAITYYNGDYITNKEKSNIINGLWYNSGIYFGAFGDLAVNEKSRLISTLVYSRDHLGRFGVVFNDDNGYPTEKKTPRIVSNNFKLDGVMLYQVGEKVSLGPGFYINNRFYSSSVRDTKDMSGQRRYKNTFYNQHGLGLTFCMGIDAEDCKFLFKLNQGLTDRIKGENKIKEFDVSASVGVIYYLNLGE